MYRSLSIFLLGLGCGCIVMLLYKKSLRRNTQIIVPAMPSKQITKIENTPTKPVDQIPFKNRTGPFIINDLNRIYNLSKDHVAIDLARRVRVLCWVMTYPAHHQTFAKAVKETWGQRCQIILFMSSAQDTNFPIIKIDGKEGKQNVWLKTRAAWKYIYERHYNDADWFLKADDDTFVVLENLRLQLDKYNTADNHVFGYHIEKKKALSVGAGYVFSKKTLEGFYNVLSKPGMCRNNSNSEEDKELFRCLHSIGISPTMLLDSKKNALFHDNKFFRHLRQIVAGSHFCCTKNIISLQKLTEHELGIYNYFFYKVRTYGHSKTEL